MDGRWRIADLEPDDRARCPHTPTVRPDPTDGGGADPPGTERTAVARQIDRLLRTYDKTVAAIAADATIAADTSHGHYDDLRGVLRPGILPVVRRRVGGIKTKSRDDVPFDLCAYRHYDLYDRWGRRFHTATGPSVAQLGWAERIDGRWRLSPILRDRSDRTRCPPESP
jgi:hypothetical protein